MSIKYNLMTIPLTIIYIIYFIWYLIDIVKDKSTLINFIDKNKKYIIMISIILFVFSLIKNINNPLLY